jgi:hypothetical protein
MGEAAKQDDLRAHVEGDWRSVHGIWANIKTYLTAHIPTYVRDYKTISLTNDSAWHDVTVAAGATVVFLAFKSINDNGTDYTVLYTRKNGETVDFDGIVQGFGRAGGGIVQECDADGKFEYYLTAVSGTAALVQMGYMKVPG